MFFNIDKNNLKFISTAKFTNLFSYKFGPFNLSERITLASIDFKIRSVDFKSSTEQTKTVLFLSRASSLK